MSKLLSAASSLRPKFECLDTMEEPPVSESESSEESCRSDSEIEDQPQYLDEAWACTFKFRDVVWVRTTGGSWCKGSISSSRTKIASTRQGKGIYYPVKFHLKKNYIAKDFAPLNGEIKPDTPHFRRLLAASGWL